MKFSLLQKQAIFNWYTLALAEDNKHNDGTWEEGDETFLCIETLADLFNASQEQILEAYNEMKAE